MIPKFTLESTFFHLNDLNRNINLKLGLIDTVGTDRRSLTGQLLTSPRLANRFPATASRVDQIHYSHHLPIHPV